MGAQKKEWLQKFAPATLYHMTHIDNLVSILEHGLFAHNNLYQQQDISNQSVNARRGRIEPIYNRSIHDYVPFYFNPRNAMLYKTQRQYRHKMVILGFDSNILLGKNTLFTNANAAVSNTRFSNKLEDLKTINWNLVFSTSWNGYPPHVKQIMMSEVLVHAHVSLDNLESINCSNSFIQNAIEKDLKKQVVNIISVTTDHSLFFGNLL